MFIRLWNLLKSLFVSSPTHPILNNEYAVKDRLLYSYWDGSKTVTVDPMTLHRKVMGSAAELAYDIKGAESPLKQADQCHESVLKRIRELFAVKSFPEGGLTELETAQLLDHFLLYCESIKKNSKPTPTSPEGTSASTGSTSAASQPTSNTSVSGSTAVEPSTGNLIPSPTASASPLDLSTPAATTGSP